MFDAIKKLQKSTDHSAVASINALSQSQAMIEFKPDGTILDANELFLSTMGYARHEIVGKHHSMFVPPLEAKSAEYAAFWATLRSGAYQSRTFQRIAKDGHRLWLQAIYVPVKGKGGQVDKVVKFATDITAAELKNIDAEGKLEALNRAQAVIEFELDGTIITANENFISAMGYSLDEIVGQHHRMFVKPEVASSKEYEQFWQDLREGQFKNAEFQRVKKGGEEVWLQAIYNPVVDRDGTPLKIVKFATDITERKIMNSDFRGKIEALNKAQAIIEFELDGTIITANDNFLNTVGYTLQEIEGQHHRMFVDPAMRPSEEYAAFWKDLANGTFQSGEYRRIDKEGNDLWLQATYNPIYGPDGKPFKVVKFATNITEAVLARDEAARIAALIDANLENILSSVLDARQKSSSAASASSQTGSMVQTVAAAAEELNISFQEIASSVASAQKVAKEAAAETGSADASTKELSSAAEAMNKIVTLINDIASQINLLALNATIESARAGEAGKGFAVVASEVKNLANQVGSATNQISEEIDRMQSISSDVVHRLSRINGSVTNLQDNVMEITNAIDEQTTVTREISGSMNTAATAVSEINQNLVALTDNIATANDYAQEGITLYRSTNS